MQVAGIGKVGVNNYSRTNQNVKFGASNEYCFEDNMNIDIMDVPPVKNKKLCAAAAVFLSATGVTIIAARGKGPKFLQKVVRNSIDSLRKLEVQIAKKVSETSGNIAQNAAQALEKSKVSQFETLLLTVKNPKFEKNALNKKEYSAKALTYFMSKVSSGANKAANISDEAALKYLLEARKSLAKAYSSKGETNYTDAFHYFFEPLMFRPKKFNVLARKSRLADSFLLQNSIELFTLKGINKKHQRDFAYCALQLAKNNKDYAQVITDAIKDSTIDKTILKWVNQVEKGKDLSYHANELMLENITKVKKS